MAPGLLPLLYWSSRLDYRLVHSNNGPGDECYRARPYVG